MLPEGINRPSAVCLNGMVDCCAALLREFSEIAQKPKTLSKTCSYSYIGSPRSLTAQRVLRAHGLYKWLITERSGGDGLHARAALTGFRQPQTPRRVHRPGAPRERCG